MKGDFTRNTFDPRKHFTRVLMQQGRVQLDADWNELNAILLHYLRALAADLIGPHGGPGDGFKAVKCLDEDGNEIKRDFSILPGHYYIAGILCENERQLAYTAQPECPLPDAEELQDDQVYLVYLDVWERHITYIQDESIREVALGRPDTATRARVVWQVKAVPVELDETEGGDEERIKELKQRLEDLRAKLEVAEEAAGETGDDTAVKEIKARMQKIQEKIARLSETRESVDVKNCDTLLKEKLAELGKLGEARLRARARLEETSEDPCITPPEARYRGAENQLYRVEIHADSTARPPTFKWSRDNGSVIFPIRSLTISTTGATLTTVTLEHLGRDSRFSLREGDWVEVVDDDYALQRRAEPLLKVTSVDRLNMQVTLEGTPASQVGQDPAKHPLLRRWDQKVEKGTVPIEEGKWLDLEDSVQIYFEKGGVYRTSDYWLIPARTATGDVEWPQERDEQGNLKKDEEGNLIPEAMEPHGVEHHYAPLAIIRVKGDGTVKVIHDCRCTFQQLCALGK